MSTLPDHIVATDWLGLSWSDWLPLDRQQGALSSLPTEAGLYRVRHPAYDRLVYIGQTGRSLRGRVGSLARGAYAEEMPYRDPHTAAPTLWAIREQHGLELEFSWVEPPSADDKQTRMSIEAALIAVHRRDTNQSPVANFGRMIPGYDQSSYRKGGFRGGPLPEGASEKGGSDGLGPLPWNSPDQPLAENWMGIDWSEAVSLDDIGGRVLESPGVYRLWESRPEITYIGQSKNLKSRLYTHRRSTEADRFVSFSQLPRADDHQKLLEVETELLGAYWLAMQEAPKDQF
jgi:hypothetical protein